MNASTWRAALVALAGSIIAMAALAAEPYGKIGEKYAALGGRGSALGPPIGNEADITHGGRQHLFKEGSIYWHPEIGEAYAVWGLIGVKYFQLGRTEFGFPITDELPTPDGRGRFNHFRAMHVPGRPESSIYWTPQTGAHEVHGLIRDAWARGGWERGELGYPTSDEFQDGGFRRSNFERGHILWSPATGVRIVKAGSGLPPAPPQTFGTLLVNGMEVAIKGRVLAVDATFLSENAVCGRYSQALGSINVALKDAIRSQVNPRMGDFSIHSNAMMQMTNNCNFRAEVVTACADRMKLRMFLPGNAFRFQVTTPTPLGSWSDPQFTVGFDVEAVATIVLPQQAGGQVGLGASTFRVTNVRLDSRNVTGDAALALVKVRDYFTGDDLVGRLAQDREFNFPSISSSLGGINAAFGQVPQGYRVNACMAGEQMRLDATDVVPREPIIH